MDRRLFTKSVAAGALGSFVPPLPAMRSPAARAQTAPGWPAPQHGCPRRRSRRFASSIRPTTTANGPQAFPQSNMVVLVDTDAGITGIGQGGSPDTVRNVARSVIGKNAFDTEMIWQAVFMDGFYSPGKERLHALGAIDMALWDIKGKALNVPLYQLFGGKAREHIELYATSGLPQGLVPQAEAQAMGLKERAAATMAAGYRVYRVDSGILPSTGRAGGAPRPRRGALAAAGAPGAAWRRPWPLGVRFEIAYPADHPGGGTDPRRRRAGRQLDDRSASEVRFPRGRGICRLMEPSRPFCVEDPVREEQFRTQIPKLRLLTTVPLAPGEEWGTRAEFSPLVEQRDIDFARASLPNVGGITEMLKIMALCDTHKVGIVPHFTGPIATAGHMHTMMAFPGQVLMEYNQGERPVPYMPEFLECRNGKVWPNDRPGLGVSVDEKALTFIEADDRGRRRRRRIGASTGRSPTGRFTPEFMFAAGRCDGDSARPIRSGWRRPLRTHGVGGRLAAWSTPVRPGRGANRRPSQRRRHPRRRHGLLRHRRRSAARSATPNLDALAARGVRFTQFYNTARCWPTRASLLTGLVSAPGGHGPSRQRRSAADRRAPRGGSTTSASRWPKCCAMPATSPRCRASGTSVRQRHAAVGARLRSHAEPARRRHVLSEPELTRGGDDALTEPRAGAAVSRTASRRRATPPCSATNWYATYLWTGFGLKFIDEARQANKPFFLYLPYNAPHFPLMAPAEADRQVSRQVQGRLGPAPAGAPPAARSSMGLIDAKWPLRPREPDMPPGIRSPTKRRTASTT